MVYIIIKKFAKSVRKCTRIMREINKGMINRDKSMKQYAWIIRKCAKNNNWCVPKIRTCAEVWKSVLNVWETVLKWIEHLKA